ncbi:hypothetical protein V6N13_072881 [Hibiscus sabdariffa]|uniref:Uncharacterized protein n=1 Tax=Hibiscus sabdariffa TaxID=183260 RepID=A0ABR2E7G4_9ROSI
MDTNDISGNPISGQLLVPSERLPDVVLSRRVRLKWFMGLVLGKEAVCCRSRWTCIRMMLSWGDLDSQLISRFGMVPVLVIYR